MRQVHSVLHPVGPRAALQGSPSPPCSEVGVSGMTQVLDSNCLQLRDPALVIYNFYCLEETLVYHRAKLNSPCAKLLAKMGNSWPPVCKTLCIFLYITDWCISLGHFYKRESPCVLVQSLHRKENENQEPILQILYFFGLCL